MGLDAEVNNVSGEEGLGGDVESPDVYTLGNSWAMFVIPVADSDKPYSIPYGEGNLWLNRILSMSPHIKEVSKQATRFVSFVSRSTVCSQAHEPTVNGDMLLGVSQSVFVQPLQQLVVPCITAWVDNVQTGDNCLYYTMCLLARSLSSPMTVLSPLYIERARQWRTKDTLVSKVVVYDDRVYCLGAMVHPFEAAKLLADTFSKDTCVTYFQDKNEGYMVLFCVEPGDQLTRYIYSDDFGKNFQVTTIQSCGIRVIKDKYALDRILRYNNIIADTVLARVPPGVHITHHNLRLQKGGQFTGKTTSVDFGPPAT